MSDINIGQACEKCGWPMCLDCKNDENILKTPHPECEITIARGTKFNLQHYFNPHPTYQCITVLRCLLLKEHSPEKWNHLIQLESHCEERRGSQQWYNDREGVARFIPRFFKSTGRWNENEILKVAGIIQINGHEVVCYFFIFYLLQIKMFYLYNNSITSNYCYFMKYSRLSEKVIQILRHLGN